MLSRWGHHKRGHSNDAHRTIEFPNFTDIEVSILSLEAAKPLYSKLDCGHDLKFSNHIVGTSRGEKLPIWQVVDVHFLDKDTYF